MQGEWRELMLMAYKFHDQSTIKHSKRVGRLLEQAIHRLRQGGVEPGVEAEALLNEALTLEPEAPDLMNNLAMAFRLQGREEESIALIRDIVNRYPDYVFASVSLAKLHLENGDVAAAEAILKPFLCRDRFNFLEFSAFADAYIELLLAQKQKDGARTWLNMWDKFVQMIPDWTTGNNGLVAV